MKCFEVTNCNPAQREECFVYNSFKDNLADMENVKCWVLKGVYREENRTQLVKCRACTYYLQQNSRTGIATDPKGDQAIITCEGVLNNDRSRALEKVWGELKKQGKFNVVLNLANVNNVYSCALGVIISMHKEALASGGMLVVAGLSGYVDAMIESTKLNRVLKLASDNRAALELFEQKRSQKAAAAVFKKSDEPIVPKKRPPCWEYWKGQNPSNATSCDECYRKATPTDDPCWLVEGMIEGVSFKYVNEECEVCQYFREFSAPSE